MLTKSVSYYERWGPHIYAVLYQSQKNFIFSTSDIMLFSLCACLACFQMGGAWTEKGNVINFCAQTE